jgi:hypothetical protein
MAIRTTQTGITVWVSNNVSKARATQTGITVWRTPGSAVIGPTGIYVRRTLSSVGTQVGKRRDHQPNNG